MEAIQATRFRMINKLLEPYFASGDLELIHCNYGYLCFTTRALHKRFGKLGNGQWQDLPDMYYFTISFDAEDKLTLKKKGIDIELWLYAQSDVRNLENERIGGKEGLGSVYSKKGFDLMYKQTILPLKEAKADQEQNNEILMAKLIEFVEVKLPRIEEVLLG